MHMPVEKLVGNVVRDEHAIKHQRANPGDIHTQDNENRREERQDEGQGIPSQTDALLFFRRRTVIIAPTIGGMVLHAMRPKGTLQHTEEQALLIGMQDELVEQPFYQAGKDQAPHRHTEQSQHCQTLP